MLAFMLASPSELGYDSTVEECHDLGKPGQQCFVYQVNDRFFKTERALCKYDTLCITGRCTRVREVVEVKGFDDLAEVSNKHYALKDRWLDASVETEGKIQERIFDDIDRASRRVEMQIQNGQDVPEFTSHPQDWYDELRSCIADSQSYRRYFLTISHECSGLDVTPNIASDAFLVSQLFVNPPPPSVPAIQEGADPSRSQNYPLADTTSAPRNPAAPKAYAPKTQYRVVIGKSL